MSDDVKYGRTYAKLLQDGTVKLCSGDAHFRWSLRGGERLSKLRYDVAGTYSIETRFTGKSPSLDGPYLWWAVIVTKNDSPPNRRYKDPSSGMLTAMKEDMLSKCATLQELFDDQPSAVYWQHLATKEQALATHAATLKLLRAQVRRAGKLPELSQPFLARLGYWCEQGWGRQTKVAKAVGATPQRVNDWINGRKKMTGEQALRVREFMRSAAKR